MPYIRTREAQRVVPSGMPALNSAFPRPVLVWTPWLKDLATGRGFLKVATSTDDHFTGADFGHCRLFRGGSSYIAALNQFNPPATVLAVWRQNVLASQPFFSFGGSGSGGGWVARAFNSGVYGVTYGGVADYPSSATYDQNKSHAVAFALAGPSYDIVEDGVYRGTTASGGTIAATSDAACVGSVNSGTTAAAQAFIGLVAVWDRQLPRGMLCRLTADPSLLFAPQLRPLYFAPAAAAFNPAWARGANSVIQPGAMAA